MSERKAFNFYNSYYEVAKELNDKDRLSFYDALITRQFTGVELELKGMAKFAFISQKHSIDAQVAGYEHKTKVKLEPLKGGSVGGHQGGSVQEKGEEEEKGEVKEEINVLAFLSWFNNSLLKYKGKLGKNQILTQNDINNLKKLKKANFTKEDFEHAFKVMVNTPWVIQNNMSKPSHFLVTDNFQKYLNTEIEENKPKFAWQ
jgi:hypothetical protein